jgi:hypothetical protein
VTATRTRATISLIAALVLGAAIGVGGDRLWLMRAPPAAMSMEPASLVREMDRRLELDSAQHTAIAAILARHQRVVDSMWARLRPALHAGIDSSQREILGVLRPDQRGPYLSWLASAHKGMTKAPRPPG